MSALRPYVLVLLVAVCVHTFLVLPLLQRLVLCRFRDVALFSFYGRIYNALLMSAATASGAATLPVALYALEQNSGLDARVARFVAPVGVIINRSGMALYLSVSGIFLAQIYKAELDLWDLSAISMRAAVASMSEPGITRGIKGHIALAGFIMGMHLQEVAILEGGLIFVEWFISLANVCGVCMAASVCQEIVRKDIGEDDLLADSLEDYTGEEKRRHY